ncbi:MAG: TonB family protein [Rhizobiales bacterium]|nr:TonB family protein [Hyphomicrobiales bacterium]
MLDWRDPDAPPDTRRTRRSASRWGAAAAFVVLAHGAAAWAALHWKPAMAAGEPPAAVMIELAPMAVAPEAPPQDVAPGQLMTEAEPEPTPDVPETPDEKPDETPEPTVTETIEKPPEEEPPPPRPPKPQIEIPKLPEKPKAEAVLTPPPPPKAEKKPPPKVKDIARKKPINPKNKRAPQTSAPPTARAQRADTAAAPAASNAQAASALAALWRSKLSAHLNRHKRFPGGADAGGTVQIAFTIDRSGRVLSSRLMRSSGDRALDEEAVSLPRRASPVPSPPPGYGGATISIAVPVRFSR